MIAIPRSLVRNCRAVFRKLLRASWGSSTPVVSILAGPDGIRLRFHHLETAAEYHHPGSYARETISLTLDALTHLEGREGEVTLETTSPSKVQARWHQGCLPRVMNYDMPEVPAFPERAQELVTVEPTLWTALADASRTTARESVRYALTRIQLRKTGTVVATDGRQLLWVEGFHFPFKEDLLIPSSTVFGCKEVPVNGSLSLGLAGKFVTLCVGEWTFYLLTDTEKRFPRAEDVIPRSSSAVAHLQVEDRDAVFLHGTLPYLPGTGDENAPVTVDLNAQPLIRARGTEQDRVSEVVLSRSQATGKPMRFAVNRNFFARALELGFRKFDMASPDSPFLCTDNRRKYVVMVLGKEPALRPVDDAIRIVSAEVDQPVRKVQKPRKAVAPMIEPNGNGKGSNGNGTVLPEPQHNRVLKELESPVVPVRAPTEVNRPVRRAQKPRPVLPPVAGPHDNEPVPNGAGHPVPQPILGVKEPDTLKVPVKASSRKGALRDLFDQSGRLVGSLWRGLGG